jgi:hypothetical protein
MRALRSISPSPSMVVAAIALLVALTGTSIAAVSQLPRNSVGNAQLRNNAVTTSKVRNGSLLRADFRSGQIPGRTGRPGRSGGPGGRCRPGRRSGHVALGSCRRNRHAHPQQGSGFDAEAGNGRLPNHLQPGRDELCLPGHERRADDGPGRRRDHGRAAGGHPGRSSGPHRKQRRNAGRFAVLRLRLLLTHGSRRGRGGLPFAPPRAALRTAAGNVRWTVTAPPRPPRPDLEPGFRSVEPAGETGLEPATPGFGDRCSAS